MNVSTDLTPQQKEFLEECFKRTQQQIPENVTQPGIVDEVSDKANLGELFLRFASTNGITQEQLNEMDENDVEFIRLRESFFASLEN